MTVEMAKKHLRAMLKDFTPGSVLHLLAEALADDPARVEQSAAVETTLFVLGLGVDAAFPRR